MSQFKDIMTEKCPVCGEGHVFAKKGNPILFRMPKMEKNCKVCGHKFEIEPGFFYGAMYVSYAVTVAEMVAVFVIAQFFTSDIKIMLGLIAATAFLLSTFNFRLSRMLWMYMFDSRRKETAG
ncbi:DUF983 domain-containing protein [Flavobacterium sp.]|uniref:DUF983 domain-containing protein n=1 Tax=Flavobacterium sp. TaxID=239 RepID=UPI0026113540|nr:DUF983 domain-containing protein [Flavobacterium sp.]